MLLLWIVYVISVLFFLCFSALLFIDVLWSPAGKGLTSWLSLAHLSQWLMVSYCDRWMSVVCRLSCLQTIASKDISSKTAGWVLTKLGRNDPYLALFNNCSNGSGPLHIKVTQDFQDENLKNLLV